MKRKALIIKSPLMGTSNYLPGVNMDALNLKGYLCSSTGGAWASEEIKIIHEPSARAIENGINSYFRRVDFGIVVFSGHGFMSNGKNYLCLNKDENIESKYLHTDAKKQIIIIDACRKDYPIDDYEKMGALGFQFRKDNLKASRHLMDYFIGKFPNGTNEIYSTSANQFATDTENGGAYTCSLIASLLNWHQQNRSRYISVEMAHLRAEKRMNTLKYRQVPEHFYYGEEEVLKFPLGVNASYLNK